MSRKYVREAGITVFALKILPQNNSNSQQPSHNYQPTNQPNENEKNEEKQHNKKKAFTYESARGARSQNNSDIPYYNSTCITHPTKPSFPDHWSTELDFPTCTWQSVTFRCDISPA